MASKPYVDRWLTASGVLVEAGYSRTDKVAAYRVPTGGFHGMLWVKNLTWVPGNFRSIR